jgi:arginine:pyruvate transaminase
MNDNGANLGPTNVASGLPISTITTSMGSAGIDAWRVHYRAVERRAAGEDVIVLSVGDPDFDTPVVPGVVQIRAHASSIAERVLNLA